MNFLTWCGCVHLYVLLQDTWESTQDAAKGTVKDIKKTAEGAKDTITGH
jgi:hypothetical protein